jgi:arabinose-5-phosphate isomerase
MLCEMTSKRSGAVSVIDGDRKLLGLVTDFDIRRVLEKGLNLFSVSISDIMNKNPTFIYSDEKALNALNLMENRAKPFLVLPVLDRQSSQVSGMVHLHDLVAKGL